MAQDIAGKELSVGQTVAFCMAGQAQNMRLATVVKVHPKTVELLSPRSKYSNTNVRRTHDSVAVIV